VFDFTVLRGVVLLADVALVPETDADLVPVVGAADLTPDGDVLLDVEGAVLIAFRVPGVAALVPVALRGVVVAAFVRVPFVVLPVLLTPVAAVLVPLGFEVLRMLDAVAVLVPVDRT
jgi:hypothetical protein